MSQLLKGKKGPSIWGGVNGNVAAEANLVEKAIAEPATTADIFRISRRLRSLIE